MYLRSPWRRAGSNLLVSLEDNEALAYEQQLPSTPGPAAETLDLERALASLSPTSRAVVWLYEVEGYSHEEIADMFGRSVSWSKSRLARAHAQLREWFEPTVEGKPCSPIAQAVG